MTDSKRQEMSKSKNGFQINLYFNKDGETLQNVMESNLVRYYKRAMYSK